MLIVAVLASKAPYLAASFGLSQYNMSLSPANFCNDLLKVVNIVRESS